MAVATGVAEVVVCWRAINARSEFRMGGTGRAAPDTRRVPVPDAVRLRRPRRSSSPWWPAPTWTPTACTAEDLGRVAITQRSYARAQRAGHDADAAHDGGLPGCRLDRGALAALRLLPRDRRRGGPGRHVARAGPPPGPAARSRSVGAATGRRSHAVLEPPRRPHDQRGGRAASSGCTPWPASARRTSTWPSLYDAFTPLVLIQLEDYGFCTKGEAAALVASGATALGGRLPVNTHGGHLSEGYVHGLNHVAEAVSQLRGDAGEPPGGRGRGGPVHRPARLRRRQHLRRHLRRGPMTTGPAGRPGLGAVVGGAGRHELLLQTLRRLRGPAVATSGDLQSLLLARVDLAPRQRPGHRGQLDRQPPPIPAVAGVALRGGAGPPRRTGGHPHPRRRGRAVRMGEIWRSACRSMPGSRTSRSKRTPPVVPCSSPSSPGRWDHVDRSPSPGLTDASRG